MIGKLKSSLEGYDVCIIGSGPAGLTIASELAHTGLKVCVLESGEAHKSEYADTLKKVQYEGLPIKNDSRERIVGGSSSTWWGLSSPLDEVDFNRKLPVEGWPITAKELEPFLTAASAYGFPQYEDFARSHYPDSGFLSSGSKLSEKVFVGNRPPYRFAQLTESASFRAVDFFTDATVVECISEVFGTERVVREVVCTRHEGQRYTIQAHTYVLAAGGIENARILLNSPAGSHALGNAHDQVGRYFMNHPKGYAGTLWLAQPLSSMSIYLPYVGISRIVYAGIKIADAYQRKRQLLNGYVSFEPDYGRLQRYALEVGRRLPRLSMLILQRIHVRRLRMRWFAEMEPNPENRIVLSDIRDANGTLLPVVRARLGERDKNTLSELARLLQIECKENAVGTVDVDPESIAALCVQDASHHLGTTRMGNDPRTSVVDANCRMHGVPNLFVAGGSVFSTSGCANPTYTIVALAIRLAAHISETVGAPKK